MDVSKSHIEHSQIAAIIAAAGRSQRMEQPKQLLPWGDSTVIATVVQNLTAAGAAPVLCIVGHLPQQITAAVSATNAKVVYNEGYLTGEMLSSYQTGIRTLLNDDATRDTEYVGTLLALGDQPHIPVDVTKSVIAQARQTPDQFVIPSYNMRRGHPFYLPRALWDELLTLSGAENLRTLLRRHTGGDGIVYVNVDTDAIRQDMDTPSDYAAIKQAAHA